MGTVADILMHRNTDVLTISAGATVFEAISRMVGRNLGSIVITDETDSIVGIFTERDYLRLTVVENRDPKETCIGDVMSSKVVSVAPDRSVEECMALENIRHIPVIENDRLVGIVSVGDLVKQLCSERCTENKYLTDYIMGRYPGEVGTDLW